MFLIVFPRTRLKAWYSRSKCVLKFISVCSVTGRSNHEVNPFSKSLKFLINVNAMFTICVPVYGFDAAMATCCNSSNSSNSIMRGCWMSKNFAHNLYFCSPNSSGVI